MIRNRWVVLICIAFAATVLSSCKAKPKTAAQAREAAAATAPTTAVASPAASANVPVAADVLSGDLAELNRRGYLKDAFFDYDKAELRPDARQALATDATWLKKYSSTRLLIEGHCDERGTDEYNLALGERRADAVREYLAAMGVGSTRVQTVSYGKERPFCNQETESCWQENRRGHMVLTAK
jgi:peptidoglycan-associated lipoprotein